MASPHNNIPSGHLDEPLFTFKRVHFYPGGGYEAGPPTGSLFEVRKTYSFNRESNRMEPCLELRGPDADIDAPLSPNSPVRRESAGSFFFCEWHLRIQFPQEFVGGWNNHLPQELRQYSKVSITWQQLEDDFMAVLGGYTVPATESDMPSALHMTDTKQIGLNSTEKAPQYVGGSAEGPGSSSEIYGPSPSYDDKGGRLILVDETNGGEVGEMGGYQIQNLGVKPGISDPVVVQLPENGLGPVTVRPVGNEDFLRDAMHPSYSKSTLVNTAITASRLIVTTSSYIANALNSGAEAYTKRSKPNTTPMTFNPSTHTRIQQLHSFSSGAAKISAETIGQVTKHAQNLGARIAGRNEDRPSRSQIANPGLISKSLVAFSTIADGIDYASKSLLGSGANAATTVVGHKYGEEARSVAYGLTGSVKNVGLVYVDASGVSRRAIIRGVAKGVVIGKVRGGGEVMIPPDQQFITGPTGHVSSAPTSLPGSGSTTPNQVGFGNGAAPPYGSIQGATHLSSNGNGYNQDSYFPPLQRSATAPQTTGNHTFSEKSPAVNSNGFRY